MHKVTITYTDYYDQQRTEDFFFNLTKAELADMSLSTTGGLDVMIQRIVAAKDTPAIAKIFKEVLLKAYGEISPDGKRFIKSEELATAFSQTEAYSELYMMLATDEAKAAEFINAIMPKEATVSLLQSAT